MPTDSPAETLLEGWLSERTGDVVGALWRGGELAWTAALAGLDQAWSAVNALTELAGVHEIAEPRAAASHSRAFIADADLKVRVEAALHADAALDDASLEVESVYDGLVVLGGRVPTLATHRHAFEAAASVPGVRRVTSIIDIDPMFRSVVSGRDG